MRLMESALREKRGRDFALSIHGSSRETHAESRNCRDFIGEQ